MVLLLFAFIVLSVFAITYFFGLSRLGDGLRILTVFPAIFLFVLPYHMSIVVFLVVGASGFLVGKAIGYYFHMGRFKVRG